MILRTYLLCLASVGSVTAAAEEAVRFNFDVRPILSNNCFHCHGPDEENRQADIRLDQPDGADLKAVIERITSVDPDVMMPPPESNKKLSHKQVDILRKWIDQGAAYQKHWAFVSPQPVELPLPIDSVWSEHPIDQFVLARLEKEGLAPNPRADKRTLIRRVTLDLTGLPPTVKEIRAFLNDTSNNAYENVVDRLLEKPQYGEHMARYWLDLVRFADTNGLHHDHYREMTPYRDWVIRSFNNNVPFDQFIIDQVAGDLFAEPTHDQLIASGFNRLHLIIDEGPGLPEESFVRNVIDRVSAVGTAFLGLTLQCAVCHDHKYDPISQRDFYQLYAFFNNFDGSPETGRRDRAEFKRGLQSPYLEFPSPEQMTQRQHLEQEIAELQFAIEEIKLSEENSPNSPTDLEKADESESTSELKALAAKLKNHQRKLVRLLQAIPATLVMKERDEIRPAHILIRGAYDDPGEVVQRDTPSFLPPCEGNTDVRTRMDLAKWLVDPAHPLTPRVTVNRFWQQLFGVGLVKTSEDFGAQGEIPSHPHLLDHLTLSFIRSDWNVKSLMRSMVLSETYQQSSLSPRESYLADPANRLLARGSRFRLDAEVIRDQILSVSGLLNTTMYGKSVKPPQPTGLWQTVTMPSSYPEAYRPDTGEKAVRRSVYSFWKRALPLPQMTIFDAPTREVCVARRERTNTPLQALVLMNEQQYFAAAMQYAKSLLALSHCSEKERMAHAYETITSRHPDEKILLQLTSSLQEFKAVYGCDIALAEAMFAKSKDIEASAMIDTRQRIELASWTLIVHSLFNLEHIRTHE